MNPLLRKRVQIITVHLVPRQRGQQHGGSPRVGRPRVFVPPHAARFLALHPVVVLFGSSEIFGLSCAPVQPRRGPGELVQVRGRRVHVPNTRHIVSVPPLPPCRSQPQLPRVRLQHQRVLGVGVFKQHGGGSQHGGGDARDVGPGAVCVDVDGGAGDVHVLGAAPVAVVGAFGPDLGCVVCVWVVRVSFCVCFCQTLTTTTLCSPLLIQLTIAMYPKSLKWHLT